MFNSSPKIESKIDVSIEDFRAVAKGPIKVSGAKGKKLDTTTEFSGKSAKDIIDMIGK